MVGIQKKEKEPNPQLHLQEDMQRYRDEMRALSQKQTEVFLGLFGLGGLSGGDSVEGTVRTAQTLLASREHSVRTEMEMERLKEKLDEANAQLAARDAQIKTLEDENASLLEENEALEGQCEQLDKYNISKPGGVANVAMQLGSMALGNVVKSYAMKNPSKVAGLLGVDVAEMLGGQSAQEESPAHPKPQGNPKVEQILSWLKAQDARTVEIVYWLVGLWDEDPNNLHLMSQWASGAGTGHSANGGAHGTPEQIQDEIDEIANEQE